MHVRFPTNVRVVPILLIAIVGMIIIVSQSPVASAGACQDEDRDGYYTVSSPSYCGNVDERDCDDTDPNIGTGNGCVYEESIEIESDVDDNIVVSSGETVIISNDATLTGNVEVNGGTLILTEGSTIDGNIESTGGTIIIEDGSSLLGNVQVVVTGEGGVLEINDATIDGNIETIGIDTLSITNSYITGNISSTDDNSVTITDNDVGKNITIDSSNSCTESGNTTGKNNSGCP